MTSKQQAQLLVKQLQRCYHQSAFSLQETLPALVQKPYNPGLLTWLGFSDPPRIKEPLSIEYAQTLAVAPAVPIAPVTKVTTLGNGVRIATESTHAATASAGIYVEAGSAYENSTLQGVSHLMEQMAFKSTYHRTHFRTVREIEAIGGSSICTAGREQMTYTVDFLQPHLAAGLEVLCDNVVCQKLQFWEVRDTLEKLKHDVSETILKNPRVLLQEHLHMTAFQGGLGNPLILPDYANLNFEMLRAFRDELYTGPRVTLAFAGRAAHDEVVELVEPLLSLLPNTPKAAPPPSEYVGGEHRTYHALPATQIILAFHAKGGWKDVKGSVVATLLQMLLGGGGTFSSGGPGKGMQSRLFKRVLCQYPWAQSCTAYSSMFDTTGLIGIAAACEPPKAGEMVKVMCDELLHLAGKPVPDEDLKRAKKVLTASVLMNLENVPVIQEDLGRQVVVHGQRKSADEYIKLVEQITSADINKFVTDLLKTSPTLVSMGDVSSVPRHTQVAKCFQA